MATTTSNPATTETPVWFITGCSTGFGRELAKHVLELGYRTVVTARKPDEVKDLVGKGEALVLKLDVTNRSEIDAAIKAAEDKFGRIDVLVNNAGIGAAGDVATNDIAQWQAVFDVNVFGVVRMSAACLLALRASEHAAIVNLASIVSWTGLPNRACYGASKGAVYALTLAMAADHAHEGIRVNCVCPGTVDTPWVGRILNDADDPLAARRNLVARQPIGRLGTAHEIATAICFLASPASGYTTGTALQIDGGTHSFVVPPVGS